MAVTQIHPIETTLKAALDYIMNPEKTDDKLLVTGVDCSPETADLQFNWTKKAADKTDGRLAYHMIQSFKPGEALPETAHEIGKRFAEAITGGEFQCIISTHIDKGHVHNHIIFNSVSHITQKKFHAAADIYHRLQRESDKLCIEYGLSVIEEKSGEKGKSHKEYSENKKGTSWKSKLRETLDRNIPKSESWEDFLLRMESDNYEIKQGKYISFKAKKQSRFIRTKTLGESYTEEKIKKRIKTVDSLSVAVPTTTESKKPSKKEQSGITLLIDIENNVKAKQSAGYSHWATVQNIKMIAKTTNYITDHGLKDYDVLTSKHDEIKGRRDSSLQKIKETESRITLLKKQIEIIDNYRKYKPVVDGLENTKNERNKEKYRNEHDTEFILFNAAKQNLKVYFGKEKLPKIKDLRAELNQLYPEKDRQYQVYYKAKDELKEIDIIKKNVDSILGQERKRNPKNRSHSHEEIN